MTIENTIRMNNYLEITIQSLENYSDSCDLVESHWKFKGGRNLVIQVPMELWIFEKDAYGKGAHNVNQSCIDNYEDWERPEILTIEQLKLALTEQKKEVA